MKIVNPPGAFEFDPVHPACRCAVCVHARLVRLLDALDSEYGPDSEFPKPKVELIQ